MPKKEAKNTKSGKPFLLKLFIAVFVIVFIIVAIFITKSVYDSIYQSIYDKEVDRVFAQFGIDPDELDPETRQKLIDSYLRGEDEGKDDAEIQDEITEKEPVECNIKPTQRKYSTGPYYTGPLIESHLHMPVASKIVSTVAINAGFEDMPAYDNELTIDYIACLFESEGIEKAFGFNVVPKMVIGQSINKVKSNEKRHPGKFVHFYQPTPLAGLNPSPAEVQNILDDNPGLFQGYGEVKFAFSEVPNEDPKDKHNLAMWDLADRNNLVVMMHPGPQHKEEAIFLLEKHPNVNFLFHSGSIGDWIYELLEDYDNAYFTLEPSNFLFGWDEGNGKFKFNPTKEEVLEYMNTNFDSALQDELAAEKARIETNPDKFLWGTDRWYTQHFDAEVGAVVEEFGRSFIGQLDPSVQEKYAYKNAERILE